MKKDILLIMSDQHSWYYTGFADPRLDTPELSRIAGDGLLFERCYCNAPLCVPSRMSFLTGLMPSGLGIFNNDSALPGDMPTIAHELGALGYETVLVGRMHFKGDDQNHGFDRHLCGDITSQYWGTGGKERRDFGSYAGTTNRLHCLEAIGGGCSPVMLYDDMVLKRAMEFLEERQEKKKSRPLFLVVGFYSPHFPFVCKEELYNKYEKRFTIEECYAASKENPLPFYKNYTQVSTAQQMKHARAAYSGLVEQLDGYIGALYDRFKKISSHRPYLFVYTSDHGEQLGRRNIYGKQTLYEDAVRVPLVITGTDIKAGIRKDVSLLDVSKTILSAAGENRSANQWHQGRVIDLNKQSDAPHWISIQQLLQYRDRKLLAEAAVYGKYKVLRADDNWYIYDLENDPSEQHNLLEPRSETKAEHLIKQAVENGCFIGVQQHKILIQKEEERISRQERLKVWGKAKKPAEWGTVKILPDSIVEPTE